MSRAKVAVVGTGISGLAAAYHIKDACDVYLFDANTRSGGHTHSVLVNTSDKPLAIDTGFMVYNEYTYPEFVKFLRMLGVSSQNTSMSFSVQHMPSQFEFCGSGFSGLFAQRQNIASLKHWHFLLEINRFNKHSEHVLSNEGLYLDTTLGDYLDRNRFSDDFRNKYLLPMSSAIWSTPAGQMLDFPVYTLVRFFKNHGLLGLTTHFQWKTISGASQSYLNKVLACFPGKVSLGKEVVALKSTSEGATLCFANGETFQSDYVILAAHADESSKILHDYQNESLLNALSHFSYQTNTAVLHTDESVMPKLKHAWSSWNYRVDEEGHCQTSYWMNNLQAIQGNAQYFVTLNDRGRISDAKKLWQGVYTHPVFTRSAIKAQEHLKRLNVGPTVFLCGSYFGYGFHEDGYVSGLRVAEALLRALKS